MDRSIVKALMLATGSKEEVAFDVSIRNENNSNTVLFESEKLSLLIAIKDIVELESFLGFLYGKEKRQVLNCTLIKNDITYSGKRKLTSKNSVIAVSLGGIRLEFGRDIVAILLPSLRSIKERVSG